MTGSWQKRVYYRKYFRFSKIADKLDPFPEMNNSVFHLSTNITAEFMRTISLNRKVIKPSSP